MGRAERARWEGNDYAIQLVEESRKRDLTPEEVNELKRGYTGYGGLARSNGQFFTPSAVTEFVVDLLDLKTGGVGNVLEPSCGAGAFFNSIPMGYNITGVEMMNEASAVARLCFPHVHVLQENTLEILPQLKNSFDYVIGNPPFMALKHNADLVGYEMARFLGKAEWYFLELAFNALRPGGICAYVVPDGILGNSNDQPGRKWLMEEAWLRAVISLPRETFYHVGTSVKTSVIVFQKKLPGVDVGNYDIFMAVAEHIGWDSRGRPTQKNDLPEVLNCWRDFIGEWAKIPESKERLPAAIPAPLPEPERIAEPEPTPTIRHTPEPEPFYAIPLVNKAKASRARGECTNMGFNFGGES